MKFEKILEEIDGFGSYQILLIVLLCTPRIVLPCHFLLNIFISAVPPHRCDVIHHDDDDDGDGGLGTLSVDQRLRVSLPAAEDGTWSSCEMFSEPQLQLLLNGSAAADDVGAGRHGNGIATVGCRSGWVYDNSTFSSTIATEWDLVCDRRGLTNAAGTIFFTGVMVGSIVFGYLCDKYGRKRPLLVCYIMSMIFCFASAFANSYQMFAVLRFFSGFGLSGIGVNSLVLTFEWVDPAHRALVGVLGSLAWSVGNMLLAALAFLVRDWRMLVVVVTAPLGLAVLTWWWIPESARWLLANGKVDEAHFYINKCAKFNKRGKKVKLEALCSVEILDNQDKNYTYLDLIRTPRIRKVTLIMGIIWFCVASSYYGISLNITGFGTNVYLTHFIYAAIEVPAKFMVYALLDVIGRRKCQSGMLLLTGLCIGTNILLPKGLWIPLTVIAILGKGFSEASFTTVFIYTSELFPTVIRQNGLGFTGFLSRLGTSVAPLILLLGDVWRLLPQVFICSAALTAGLACLLLPETKGLRLAETIQDIEESRNVVPSQAVETSDVYLETKDSAEVS